MMNVKTKTRCGQVVSLRSPQLHKHFVAGSLSADFTGHAASVVVTRTISSHFSHSHFRDILLGVRKGKWHERCLWKCQRTHGSEYAWNIPTFFVLPIDIFATASVTQLYAFFYTPNPPFPTSDGWSIYSPREEFGRMGIGSRTKAWRFTDINKDYSVGNLF